MKTYTFVLTFDITIKANEEQFANNIALNVRGNVADYLLQDPNIDDVVSQHHELAPNECDNRDD